MNLRSMTTSILPKPGTKVPELADLTPYLSAALMKILGRSSARTAVEKTLAAAAALQPGTQLIAPKSVGPGVWSGALIYEELRSPSWWSDGPKESHLQHMTVIAKGAHLAVCASDAAFRERMVSGFFDAKLATTLPRKQMTDAFVGPEAKTAWLNGIHTPTAVKANAKMLSGSSLEYAIDPLGDHTYALSALRSCPAIQGLKQPSASTRKSGGARKRSIGAAPGRSRIWLGPSKNWDEFITQMTALLDHLTTATSQSPLGLAALADAIDGFDGLGKAHAIALLPASLTDEDATVGSEQFQENLRIAYDADFEISATSKGGFESVVSIDGEVAGTIAVTLKKSGDKFEVSSAWSDPEENEVRRSIKEAIGRRNGIKIYYDDGKTFADGRLFSTKFVEAEFGWTSKDFAGFDVHREKPTVVKGGRLIDAITAETDTSLFDFVRKEWGCKGMLACDDGSMELADFLHFDVSRMHIELIHVKAAGGSVRPGKSTPKRAGSGKTSADRLISVSDYEIVAAQAIKNVRHLDKDLLVVRLEQSSGHQMAAATWNNGVRVGDRKKLIDALKRAPKNLTRGVTILQPRLTIGEIEICRTIDRSTRRAVQFNQLNALMLATAQAVKSLGAEFTGIADGTP